VSLSFPNPSRSFEPEGNRVLFWGYDSVIEVSIFVEADALQKLVPTMARTEAGLLEAFDAVRARVEQVASKVYVRGAKGACTFVLGGDAF